MKFIEVGEVFMDEVIVVVEDVVEDHLASVGLTAIPMNSVGI